MKKLRIFLLLLFATPCFAQLNQGVVGALVVAVPAAPPGITDAFTDTDAVHVLDHHMTYNGTSHWTCSLGAAPDGFVINTNAVQGGAWADSNHAFYSPSTVDSSQITHKASTPTAAAVKACVRMPANNSGYCVGLSTISGANYTTVDVTKNGVYLSGWGSVTYATASDHTVKITASGTTTVTISVWIDGGEMASTLSDSTTPLGAGNSGFQVVNNNGSARIMLDDYTDQ